MSRPPIGALAAVAVAVAVLVHVGAAVAPAAEAQPCGTFDDGSCGVTAHPAAGEFRGLIAVAGAPWVLEVASHSGGDAGCEDCVWSVVLACMTGTPADPGSQRECTAASNSSHCPPRERLYRLYLTTGDVLDRLLGTICLGDGRSPIRIGDRAKADVGRYLKNVVPPALDIAVRPRGATLAGLPTSFTAAPPATLAPVRFGPGPISETITLRPIRTRWRWGDGSGPTSTTSSRTVTHVFWHGGVMASTLATRWAATYTITFEGVTVGPFDATGRLTRRQPRAVRVDTTIPTLVSG